jgi:hypothetical protein
MKTQPILNYLVPGIAILALVAAAFGLFTPREGSLYTFTTARGETVDLWGQGLYRFDTPIGASGFLAGDIITLALAIPILLFAFAMYRRSSLKGGLLLSGALAYFLYTYASLGFGAAYNNFFLAYTLIFSASLYGLIVALLSFDVQALRTHFGVGLPRKGIGLFLIISGVILSLIWLVLSIVPALIANKAAPEAYYYTTFTTGIIDVGMVAPALLAGGVLIRRNAPSGCLFASTLLIFTCILGANLTAGGIMQVTQGIITFGQAMTFTVPFVILSVIAIWFTFILCNCSVNFTRMGCQKRKSQRQ